MPSGQIRDSRNLVLMALHHYLGAEGFTAWEKSQPHTQELASLSTDCTRPRADPLGPHSLFESSEEPWGEVGTVRTILILLRTGGFRDLSKVPQLLLGGTRIPGQGHISHGPGPGDSHSTGWRHVARSNNPEMQLRAVRHIVSGDKRVVFPGLLLLPAPRQGPVVASHMPPASLAAASSGAGVDVSLQHPLGSHPSHPQNPVVCLLVLCAHGLDGS